MDAFVPRDAFAFPDVSSPADAFFPDTNYDSGPPATWPEVYALFTNARCGGSRGCHYASASGGISFTSSAAACAQLHLPGRSPTCIMRDRIVAGEPFASLLYRKLSGPPPGCGNRMPDGRPLFTPDELSIVARWIYAGARCP